jgi:hypothetical protein
MCFVHTTDDYEKGLARREAVVILKKNPLESMKNTQIAPVISPNYCTVLRALRLALETLEHALQSPTSNGNGNGDAPPVIHVMHGSRIKAPVQRLARARGITSHKTSAEIAEMKRLKRMGWTKQAIATELGMSWVTVAKYLGTKNTKAVALR